MPQMLECQPHPTQQHHLLRLRHRQVHCPLINAISSAVLPIATICVQLHVTMATTDASSTGGTEPFLFVLDSHFPATMVMSKFSQLKPTGELSGTEHFAFHTRHAWNMLHSMSMMQPWEPALPAVHKDVWEPFKERCKASGSLGICNGPARDHEWDSLAVTYNSFADAGVKLTERTGEHNFDQQTSFELKAAYKRWNALILEHPGAWSVSQPKPGRDLMGFLSSGIGDTIKALASLHCTKRRKLDQRPPLTVAENAFLEECANETSGTACGLVAFGFFSVSMYGRLIFSDAMSISSRELDFPVGSEHGCLECAAEICKTGASLEERTCVPPVAITTKGFTEQGWSQAAMRCKQTTRSPDNLEYFGHKTSRYLHLTADETCQLFHCGREVTLQCTKCAGVPTFMHPSCAGCFRR